MGLKYKYFLFVLILLIPVTAFAVTPTATPTIGPAFAFENFAVNGSVYALTNTASQLFIGGSFSMIGQRSGSLMYSNYLGNQITLPRFPMVDGSVYAICKDESGGYYIGGSFNYVAGQYRRNLARILSDGSLDPDFRPYANSTVRCMTKTAAALYIGGSFSQVAPTGGVYVNRSRWASINPITGEINAADCSFNSTVYAIGLAPYTLAPGSYMMVGGSFTTVSGTARVGLVTINPNTGVPWSYDYNLGAGSTVYDVAFAFNGTYPQMFVGGSFTSCNGVTRNRLAMYDRWYYTSPNSIDFNMSSTVRALYFDELNKTLYAAGDFTYVNGLAANIRNHAAAFLTSTAVVLPWDPDINGICYSINGDPGYIYVGGSFTRVKGNSYIRLNAACFSRDTTGAIYANFDPNPNGQVNAINPGLLTLEPVLIGGNFNGIRSVERNNAASVVIGPSYSYYSWNPNIDGPVYALTLGFGRIYAGGNFSTVNGSVARLNIAAFDVSAGTVDATFIASADSTVRALWANQGCYYVAGEKIYVGGDFTMLTGLGRRYIGAVDPATGATYASFNPDPNSSVYAISARDAGSITKYYIQFGGVFTTTEAGTVARPYFAEYHYGSGGSGPCNYQPNSYVLAIHNSPINNMTYIGGAFNSVLSGAYSRPYIASFPEGSNTVSNFIPYLNSWVWSINSTYNALLVGGDFNDIDGIERGYCAAFDLKTNALSTWYPYAGSSVLTLLGYNNYIVAGGYFSSVDLMPHGFGAVLGCPPEMYTFTATRTISPTYTATRTYTRTATRTHTRTVTSTGTVTRTATGTATTTATRTVTQTSTPTPVSVFAFPILDTFVDDYYRWDYGPEWERGYATASSGHNYGYPDPSIDVSAGADNNVAGTAIGGNISRAANHGYFYLTSSFIDASAAPQLQLRYWQYLNCDHPNYISATVEVYNGSFWIPLYVNPGYVAESEWREVVEDVTAYKSNRFRVRFGHAVSNAIGAYDVSGWNIDDVYIGMPFTPTVTLTNTISPTSTITETSTATPCIQHDNSFNGGLGYNSFDRAGDFDGAMEMSMDGFGRILVGGNANDPSTGSSMCIWRYLDSGVMDLSFGLGGYMYIDQAPGTNYEYLMSLRVDASNRVLTSGYFDDGSIYNGSITRHIDSGPDPDFNGGMTVVVPNVAFCGIDIDNSGRIVAGAAIFNSPMDGAIYRFLDDGSIDASFNAGAGMVMLPDTGADEYPWKLRTDANSNIIAVGMGNNGVDMDIYVWKINSDGTLDTSFNGGAGVYSFNGPNGGYEQVADVIIDYAGRIVVAGTGNNIVNTSSSSDGVVIRLNADGTPDTAFALGQGWIGIDNGGDEYFRDIAEDKNRRLVMAGSGYWGVNQDMAMWRILQNGGPDFSFSPGGVYRSGSPFGSSIDVNAMCLDESNRINLAGSAYNQGAVPPSNDMIVGRFIDICSIFSTSTPTITRTSTPTPTFTATKTITQTATPSATRTATLTVTQTVTGTWTPTATSTFTWTPTASPTRTGTPTFTGTPTGTRTVTQTITQTVTQTITQTVTRTYTRTATQTATPTRTFTRTATSTVTGTCTPTATGTATTSATMTSTQTFTPSFTATPTITVTPTITQTHTVSDTPTIIVNTWTITPTHSVTPTITETSTKTITSTVTGTVTRTITQTWTPTLTVTKTATPTWTLTVTETVTETVTGTVTQTVTETVTKTATQTVTSTVTPSVTQTVTETYTPTATATDTCTVTETWTPTSTATGTHTPTVTRTATMTPTGTITSTVTGTATETVTQSSTETPSYTATRTVTSTRTFVNTRTATATRTVTDTETATITETETASPTDTNTPRPTLTFTETFTVTETVTGTSTKTVTETITETHSYTYTATGTVTDTVTVTVTETLTLTSTLTLTMTDTPIDTLTPTITETQCPAGILGNGSSAGTNALNANNLYGSRFDLLQRGTIYNINLYISAGVGNFVMGIYSDLLGHPNNLLMATTPQVIVAGAWNTIEIPFNVFEPGSYWIVFQASGSGIYFRYQNSAADSGMYISNMYGSFPDPFVDTPSYTSRAFAAYANFCPETGSLITATITPTITETQTYSPTVTATPQFTSSMTPTITMTPTIAYANPDDDAYAFPLPASGTLSFCYNLAEAATEVAISIYDFAGNYVMTHTEPSGISGKNISQVVDVSRLRPGIYYYLIKAKGVSGSDMKIKVKKFIIKRQ